MKKLLILPVVLGVAACGSEEVKTMTVMGTECEVVKAFDASTIVKCATTPELAAIQAEAPNAMFITMEDTDKIGADGFPIQAHTVHIGECLWPDENLSAKENVNMLMEKNYQFCVDTYEKFYNTKLKFNIKEEK